MAAAIRPLVAGNWKMNGLKAALNELAEISAAAGQGRALRADIAICPPATLVAAAAAIVTRQSLIGGQVLIGGQDCDARASGAHTGDVSAEMLKDAGASLVIVGHSERRAGHGESNADVQAKAAAALRAGLIAVICVGETRAQREAGQALELVGAQVAGSIPPGAGAAQIVVAYEPVWAIGTGLTPTPADVAEVHACIRARLERQMPGQGAAVRILYGGSVKPSNAAELMAVPNVNGALVGGASLKADEFMAIAGVFS